MNNQTSEEIHFKNKNILNEGIRNQELNENLNYNFILLSINMENMKIIVFGYDKIFCDKLKNKLENKRSLNFDFNSILLFDEELMKNIEKAKKFFNYYKLIKEKKTEFLEKSTIFFSKNKKDMKNLNKYTYRKEELIRAYDSEASSDEETSINSRQWIVKCAYYRFSRQNNFDNIENKLDNYKSKSEVPIKINKKKRDYNENDKKINRKIDFLDEEIYSSEKLYKIIDSQTLHEQEKSNIIDSFIDINKLNYKIINKNFQAKGIFKLNNNFENIIQKENHLKQSNEFELKIDIDNNEIKEEEMKANELINLNSIKKRIKKNASNKNDYFNNNSSVNLIKNDIKKKTEYDIEITLYEDKDFAREEWQNMISEDCFNYNIEKLKFGKTESTNQKFFFKDKIFKERNLKDNNMGNKENIYSKLSTKISEDTFNEYKFTDVDYDLIENNTKLKFVRNDSRENSHLIDANNIYKINSEEDSYFENLNGNFQNKSETKNITYKNKDFFRNSAESNICNKFSPKIPFNREVNDNINLFHINKDFSTYLTKSIQRISKIERRWKMIDQVMYICRVIDYISKKQSLEYDDEDTEYLYFYITLEILRYKNFLDN